MKIIQIISEIRFEEYDQPIYQLREENMKRREENKKIL